MGPVKRQCSLGFRSSHTLLIWRREEGGGLGERAPAPHTPLSARRPRGPVARRPGRRGRATTSWRAASPAAAPPAPRVGPMPGVTDGQCLRPLHARRKGPRGCPTSKFRKRVASTRSPVSTSPLAQQAGRGDSDHQVTAPGDEVRQEAVTPPAPATRSAPRVRRGDRGHEGQRGPGSGRASGSALVAWWSTAEKPAVAKDTQWSGVRSPHHETRGSSVTLRREIGVKALAPHPGTAQDRWWPGKRRPPGPGPRDGVGAVAGSVPRRLQVARTLQVVLAQVALVLGLTVH